MLLSPSLFSCNSNSNLSKNNISQLLLENCFSWTIDYIDYNCDVTHQSAARPCNIFDLGEGALGF